jgi:hypothetical protein
MVLGVERSFCKRSIQCLASPKILTPTRHPLTARRVCTPPPLVRGEDTLARGRGGGGGSIFWKTPNTALHVLYICMYFVVLGVMFNTIDRKLFIHDLKIITVFSCVLFYLEEQKFYF